MSLEPQDPRQHVLDLVEACRKHDARFFKTPGVLMIELDGLERVLGEVADGYLVLGFDSFTLPGDGVVAPRLDYLADFGEGIPVPDALAAIEHWSDAPEELWIEAVLKPK